MMMWGLTRCSGLIEEGLDLKKTNEKKDLRRNKIDEEVKRRQNKHMGKKINKESCFKPMKKQVTKKATKQGIEKEEKETHPASACTRGAILR
jgi:hypothetical protein